MFDFLQRLSPRLHRQIGFLLTLDRLKNVERRTWITGQDRRENSAEHSWHVAVAALVLSEYASSSEINLEKVMQMLLLHDIVEIEAGDTFLYDEHSNQDKKSREQEAANRLFGLLPEDQAAAFRSLWEEFEGRETPEAKFAAAVDRILPILMNFARKGQLWREHSVRAGLVRTRNRHIEDGSKTLWDVVNAVIDEAVAQGFLEAGEAGPTP
jgi:putative hydrolase of HD superfamily